MTRVCTLIHDFGAKTLTDNLFENCCAHYDNISVVK